MAFSKLVDGLGNRPSVPRDAAAVILIRNRVGTNEAEVFMVRRHAGASFMAGSFVFPGGAEDPEDGTLEKTAVRELFEEARVRIAPGSLHYFSHWITPSFEKKRFSARFFIAELPSGQVPTFDNVETVDEVWVTPTEGLDLADNLRLPPPQLYTMYELRNVAPSGSAAVLALARERAAHPHPIVPRGMEIAGDPPAFAVLLPWDPDYACADGEGVALPPDHPLSRGPSRMILGSDGWTIPDAPP